MVENLRTTKIPIVKFSAKLNTNWEIADFAGYHLTGVKTLGVMGDL